MKIMIIGATGWIGGTIAEEAKRQGHEVTAVSRSGGQDSKQASVTDTAQIASLAEGHDAIVLAISPPRDGSDAAAPLLAAGSALIEAANIAGVKRVMVVGGAGSLLTPDGTQVVDSPGFPEEVRAEALAHGELLELIRRDAGALDWTYVSPAPQIQPGERTGTYRVGGDQVIGGTVSVDDYAVGFIDELVSGNNIGKRINLAAAES